MASNPTQTNRIAELTTPLGKDKLLLSSFTATEELSRPFEVRIDCVSKDDNIDFSGALGLNARIRMNTVGKKKRYFSGIIVEAGWFGERDGLSAYQLVLRPWFWLLTQTSDCRIFQNKSVTDIIKDVFSDAGFHDFELKTTESYKPIEYCVQYRESHFDFVSRLMEKFGIYYFFKHSEDKHMMVLADAKSSHQPIAALPQCKFAGLGDRTRDTEEYVTTWRVERRFRTGKVAVNAFDFTKPTANLLTDKTAAGGYAHDKLEVYLYPEKYKKGDEQDVGQKYAQARLQSTQAQDKRRYATGDAPSLYPGGLTTLVKFKTSEENREYLVLAATHSFMAESYTSGSASAAGDSYRGSYVLLPSDRPFKAPLVTPRPVIYGPQTAMVVGPKGEEIYTDVHGRIKLKFHWDRKSKGDETSSRWVRVSQIWSGKAWGGIVIPRIGMEAVVEFIEGDPDRPLVVGTVYNGDNKPPFALPDNKTQAGLKTRSSKGGNDSTYNELIFEDKKGNELVRFHAEKDLNSTVEDGEIRTVKGKNKAAIGETTRGTTVEKGDEVLKVTTGDNNITIGNDQKVEIGNNQKVTVTVNQTVKVGNTITVEAGTQIVLKVGASSITMDSSSVTIETPQLNLKSVKTKIEAAALIEQTAALIKLN